MYMYWPCTYYRKGPIAENSYLFQYRAFLLFFVHIVKYLYKLMICWTFHIIPTRNCQDIDAWNIYLHFLGHMRLGDSANKCACAKIKNRNIRNFGFYIELFHSLKHFNRLSFIFTSILSQSYEKIAAMSNSIEWRYETDTCSVTWLL